MDNINSQIGSQHHRKLNLAMLLTIPLLLAGLAAGVFLSQQGQENRSKASEKDVQLKLTSNDKKLKAGDIAKINVLIDTKNQEVSAIDLRLNFPADKFEGVRFAPGTFLKKVILPGTFASGSASMVLIAHCGPNNCKAQKGSGVVASLQLKVKQDVESGKAEVKIIKKSAVASVGQKNDALGRTGDLAFQITGKTGTTPTPSITPPPGATTSASLSFSDSFIWVSSDEQFTDEQKENLAENYKIVVIGNAHASWDQEKVNNDAADLIELNPNLKVFPYFSAAYKFAKAKYGTDTFKQKWYLEDKKTKKPIPKENDSANKYIDLSNAEYRKWAVDIIKSWMEDAPYAGIALDAATPIDETNKKQWVKKIGQKKIDAWNKGLVSLFREIKVAIGPKLLIYNGIAGNRNVNYLSKTDLALNEAFCYQRNADKFIADTNIQKSIDLMYTFAGNGKGVLQKVNYYDRKDKKMPTAQELVKIGRFCFGSFLMGYQPGSSYFKFGPGYRADLGEIATAPAELTLRLGAPEEKYKSAKDLKDKKDKKKDKDKKKNKDKDKGKDKGKDNQAVWQRLFANGRVYVNFSDKPFTVIAEERLIFANGGVLGKILEPGDEVPLGPSDAIFLLKTAAGPTPPPEEFIEGDLDRDGDVDIYDYNELVFDFGKTGSPGFIPADINKNGEVDIYDYNTLVHNYTDTE